MADFRGRIYSVSLVGPRFSGGPMTLAQEIFLVRFGFPTTVGRCHKNNTY